VIRAAFVLLFAFTAGEPADPAAALAKAAELRAAGDFEGAVDVLSAALEAAPGDARLLLELGRVASEQGFAFLAGEEITAGRLTLTDAIRWLSEAAAAAPVDPEPQRLIGSAAMRLLDFPAAAEAFGRAAALDPTDGESRYQQAFALAYQTKFAEALPHFLAAERLLGPDPRVLLNLGITRASLDDLPAAVDCFLRLIEGEAEAGRSGSDELRSAWSWLWRVHSERRDFAGAEAVFLALSGRRPQLFGAWWYLGHARKERGNHAGAAEAFAKLSALAPAFAAGFAELGSALGGAGRYPEAEEALGKLVVLDPEGEATRDLLLALALARAKSGSGDAALALFARHEEVFGGDAIVVEARGDLLFRLGRAAEALRTWRAARELTPFTDELDVKAEKAATVLLRSGAVPADLAPARRVPEGGAAAVDPEAPGEAIFDFERSEVYARVIGAAEGVRTAGVYSLRRSGDAGRPASLALLLIPTVDTRPFESLRFRVKGPAGTHLLVRAKDGYDQMEFDEAFLRLLHREPVALTGEWQLVDLPLAGFGVSSNRRPIPMNRAALRALVFEIGLPMLPGTTPAAEVEIDEVALRPAEGEVLVLADFDHEPRETLFLSDGAATPFAPTLFSPEQVAAFRPDPNTHVTPAILGAEYDPAMVHGGTGSYRLVLPQEGEAAGVLSFNPDRGFERAAAITFWARGEKGGEKLRVVLRDAMDDALENPAPAVTPRVEHGGRLAEGVFALTKEWQRYTILRSDFPDVHFGMLTELRFSFGTTPGNPPGPTLYLDDSGDVGNL
jgi:tetratricopeptide (TPR) repeat protein